MNAVEIEEAISKLAEEPFDRQEFAYQFLEAFGNKSTTIQMLRSGSKNKSDIENGVLQDKNIHLATCDFGQTQWQLDMLRQSPATTRQKAKFILATDGVEFVAEDLVNGDAVSCSYSDFPNHFGFFLPLAGISTVKQIRENSVDIRATSRLNKLYVELLKTNPDWASVERRHDMNHFMARLIFCFFSEDTGIFRGNGLFTLTVEQMSAGDASNTHEVISEIFRAMNVPTYHEGSPDDRYRKLENVRGWADQFPYVNGGLFSDNIEVPRFSKIARAYLLNVGRLDWRQINPDIFGSMIQAVADDEERGSLGMHYTSVPNILKVLNPLFLDDLRAQLDEASDNSRKLLNLRNRMSRIRIFDPACGSGNFLVIAYKQMREIEADINKRRNEPDRHSEIPLTNFRGIEIRDFAAEIARLALIIAEYQCNVAYRGEPLALAEFLPLDKQNWIVCGNALRLDWFSVCPPSGHVVNPIDQNDVDFQNEGGETYICGNPPYLGSKWQSDEQKKDLKTIFCKHIDSWKSLDYVAGWFMKAADYGNGTNSTSAFVSTNSICQGQQVPILWPLIFETGQKIVFAHTSFKWANLASNKAGVTVVIVGISNKTKKKPIIFSQEDQEKVVVTECDNINSYLVPGKNVEIEPSRIPISNVSQMLFGNMPRDGGNFVLSGDQKTNVLLKYPEISSFIRLYLGSEQMIQGKPRWCIWISDDKLEFAQPHPFLKQIMQSVRDFRLKSEADSTQQYAKKSHRFVQIAGVAKNHSLAIAKVSSERRPYLPVDLLTKDVIVSDLLFAIYDEPLWNMSLIASRLHLVWIATVCGKLKTDFRYSNTLGWNTFPVPMLTDKNKTDLTKCAEDILLAREVHFPATIADLYDSKTMPENLRQAHDRNDEVLERIYIGRRFKNDTERLEKLFELYTKMTINKDNARRKSA